ncbi:MAG: hypothetical protein ABIS86_22420, partial [Streptosporangiaceae bacterium]
METQIAPRRLSIGDVGLPVLMMALQVLAVPAVADLIDEPVEGWPRIINLFTYGACAFALVWRRSAPGAVTAVVGVILFLSGFWLPEFAVT